MAEALLELMDFSANKKLRNSYETGHFLADFSCGSGRARSLP